IAALLERYYQGDESRVPTVGYLGATSSVFKTPSRVQSKETEAGARFDALVDSSPDWLRALLTSPIVVQDRRYVNNMVQRVLKPQTNQDIMVELNDDGRHTVKAIDDLGIRVADVSIDADNLIRLNMYSAPRGQTCTLELLFRYQPTTPFAPIHEVMEGRNERIKQFYAQVWFEQSNEAMRVISQTVGIPEYEGETISVDAGSLEAFCRTIGNTSSHYIVDHSSTAAPIAPMDYTMRVFWPALCKCLMSPVCDGDLTCLVHLSNEFRIVDGMPPIQAGQQLSSRAQITEVVDGSSGRMVRVQGHVLRNGQPIVALDTSFLFRGQAPDYASNFRNADEPPMELTVADSALLALIRSKEWLIVVPQMEKHIRVGSILRFGLRSQYRFKSASVYSYIATFGEVLARSATSSAWTKVADVDFECANAFDNPVMRFLRTHGQSIDSARQLLGDGREMSGSALDMAARAPSSNQPYSDVSTDHNPIHTSQQFADLVGLPGTITHGMWTSAAARRTLERVAANGNPSCVVSYNARFVDMVLPGAVLETRLQHTGFVGGRMQVQVETVTDGKRVLEGAAEVEQPRTAYVFTGQGAHSQGMGMALYQSSAAARRVWDAADTFMRDTYGIPLLDIVRTNPPTVTVHFAGKRGERVRDTYRAMQYEYFAGKGLQRLVSRPLFADITEHTPSHTFSAPRGLLFATQFTQPAMLVCAAAEFAHLREAGVVPEHSVFAGHSLGEYAGLCAVARVLTPETAADIGFCRGLTMQQAVRRDTDGRSIYAMLAASPARVAHWFTSGDLAEVVAAVKKHSDFDGLLEIVNHNIRDAQYVVAGERVLLEALSLVLVSMSQLSGMPDNTELAMLAHKSVCLAAERHSRDRQFELSRTRATTPVPGIDVPFHSSVLREGTWSFRKLLQSKIKPEHVSVKQLCNRYVPNLTARPFAISRAYIECVYKLTQSEPLAQLLESLDEQRVALDPQYKQHVAYTLLVEVLSYQFASPVRWIETQDTIIEDLAVERVVEVGPGNVLANMFSRTLDSSRYASLKLKERLTVLCSASDMDSLTFTEVPASQNSDSEAANTAETAPLPPNSPEAKPAPEVQPAIQASAQAAPIEVPDAPTPSLEIIRALAAYKLKLGLEAVADTAAIKDLVGGKSTLQNELVGDLQKEFGGDMPDKPEELPLRELAQGLSPASNALGKVTTTLVSRMLASKMPGGFTKSAICQHLHATYGLGSLRQHALLLVALAMEPSARLDSEASAKSWLDTVAQKYAHVAGISFASAPPSPSGDQRTVAPRAVAVINSEAFERAQKAQQQLATRTMHALATYLGTSIDQPLAISSADSASADLDVWLGEYGQAFCDGIRPAFAPLKMRRYDSFWNWARQDLIQLYFDILSGKVTKIDLTMSSHCLRLMNRVTPALVDVLNYIVDCAKQGPSAGHALAAKYGVSLIRQCELGIHASPAYQFTEQLRAPRMRINGSGRLEYFEVNRSGETSICDYVRAVCSSDAELASTMESKAGSSLDVVLEKLGLIRSYPSRQSTDALPPMVHLRSRGADPAVWSYDSELSAAYTDILCDICDNGLTLGGRRALITGCGRGSIGAEVLKGLLEAGAQVVATTSSYSAKTTRYFQNLYQTHGSRGSSLTILPFNQASRQDVTNLVDYIYSDRGLNWDLDFVLPFAAIPELGHDVTELDAQSELSHRAMLTNVMRLLGAIASCKQQRRLKMHPTLAILPLSPNHGSFGYDGHYSESKLGLETLLNRWHSEPTWSEYVSVAGAVIGWTRGTGLMSGNNVVAEFVERTGVRTFSAAEMAFNILGLLHSRAYSMAAQSPIWADLAGRFQYYPQITQAVIELHQALAHMHDTLKTVTADSLADFGLVADDTVERVYNLRTVTKRANHKFQFPQIKSYDELDHLRHLQGMINLDQVVVVTGYGEVGPYGNAETRWEMEAFGEFSLEGCIELAWIMGYIKHFNGRLKTKQLYSGWVDAKTEEPIDDKHVKQRYEKQILEHTGIRLIEPELLDGYDPNCKTMLRELQIEHDMEPFEATEDEAQQFKLRNGDRVHIWEHAGSWQVRLLKGATLMVPKALRFDRLVAAQLPTGWSPERYGIPRSIADQVDPITCYALVATTEALVRSGITDPYELYKYVHVSEVGSSTGTALGGLRSTKRVFAERLQDKDQQPDVYQETFLSTPPAWINMLLMSASGPIKTTIGACATGVASIDVAVDTIQSGKAKIMLAGGTDALCEESSYEFAQMNATSSTISELEQGRTPREMSRPCTTTRNGFMESEGAGIVTLMSAATAIELGAPIYGIVAMTSTATDKEGRSVPAPGKGVLTSAREAPGAKSASSLPILDIEYRRRQLQLRQLQIREWGCQERELLSSDQHAFIDAEAKRQQQEALDTWGNNFWKRNPHISPLRSALAAWGLTVDDIAVASFHGTSTKANDKNESEIIERQFRHLGRTPGNVVFSVCQKYLTGHPKGPASIWMLNGVLQMLRTGIVPGNRNADNISAELEDCQFIVYPSRSIRTPGIKAALLKSFGFGQVGGECLMVHPDYLYAVLDQQQLESYASRVAERETRAYRYWHDTLTDNHPFVQVKTEPPYSAEDEEALYLDPLARIH
ncbi:fatty acid synthase alpha subunit Lsd1, partial [Coemansia sp. RSA 2611]